MKFYLKSQEGRFVLDYGERVNGDTVADPCRIPFLYHNNSRLLTNSFVFPVPPILKDKNQADSEAYVQSYYRLFNKLYQSFDYISTRCLEKTLGLYAGYMGKDYRSSVAIRWGSSTCIDFEYGIPMALLMLQIEAAIQRNGGKIQNSTAPILKYYMGFMGDKRSKKQREINRDIGDIFIHKPISFPTRRTSLEKKMPDVDNVKIGCVTLVPIKVARQNSRRDPIELLGRSIKTQRYGLSISKLDAFSPSRTPPFYDFNKSPKSLLYPGVLLYPDGEPSIYVPPVLARTMQVAN